MTLDEAIKHCNEVACKHDECTTEHKQLAQWLMELKELKEQKPANKVEPKFKVGDHIKPIDKCLGSPRIVEEVCDGWYVTDKGTLYFEFEDNWELVEQNNAWSEEDENRFRNLIYLVEHSNEGKGTKEGFIKFINRLKSLRPQNTWKPSDEQIDMLKIAVSTSNSIVLDSLYNDLKKLREE